MTSVDRTLWDLAFRVWVSQRYYAKRHAFFHALDRGTTFVSALSATGAFGTLLAELPGIALYASLVVALTLTTSLVFGFGELSSKYNQLYRRYSDLAVSISRTANPSASRVRELTAQRFEIAKDELLRLGVIEAKCYNEEIESQGLDDGYKRRVRPYQIPLAHVITLPPDDFPPLS